MTSTNDSLNTQLITANATIDELTSNAAELNGTSPEAISALIETLN